VSYCQLFQIVKQALALYGHILKYMAGDEGFEPPILGPEPSALPLGQSPLKITVAILLLQGKIVTKLSQQY
jgi:hypothetical protein